jgi:hypothetical protein
MLSDGPAEAIRLWLYFILFHFLEGARHEAVGCHPFFHSEGPCDAEMVGSARTAGGWMTTSLL